VGHTAAVVLAAGQGTRMKSARTKVLLDLGGQAVVKHVTDACEGCGISRIIVVVGTQADAVKTCLGSHFEYAHQAHTRGTADAVKCAVPLLTGFTGRLVVIPGDAPLVTAETLEQLLQVHGSRKQAATVLTAVLADGAAYGRIIRDEENLVVRIVERKVARKGELEIREVNSGVYCFEAEQVLPLLDEIEENPVSGEYYLTDIVGILVDRGYEVLGLRAADPRVMLGVNTPEDLNKVRDIMRERMQQE